MVPFGTFSCFSSINIYYCALSRCLFCFEEISIPSNKIEIINNGIDISQFLKTNKINNISYIEPSDSHIIVTDEGGGRIKKIKNKFVWSSRTERGLHIVLNLWNEILEKLPDATLDICSYGKFPKDKEDESSPMTLHAIIHHCVPVLTTEELKDRYKSPLTGQGTRSHLGLDIHHISEVHNSHIEHHTM